MAPITELHGCLEIHACRVDDQIVVHDIGNILMKRFTNKCLAPLFTVFDPLLGLGQGNAIFKRNISDPDIQRGNDTDTESVFGWKNEIGSASDDDASALFFQ